MIRRYLESQIRSDMIEKMVFIGGPRQAGKTTLARELGTEDSYLNYDYGPDRARILRFDLPDTDIWIFDELHKFKTWRNHLKGIFDKFKGQKSILVTGSARLDLLRRGGDSLQGRYHFLRLYPLTIDELEPIPENLQRLFNLSGFPEPYLSNSKLKASRWSHQYRQRILEDDIRSVEVIEDLGKAELLLLNLPDRVGSPISINSLREDLDVSHRAVKRWLDIFENFYAIFTLKPFGAKGLRSLKKERKHYHYDWTVIESDGARFECLLAVHLLKRIHFLNDSLGRSLQLEHFRDTDKREVDFVITEKDKPLLFVEAKYSYGPISPHLKYLKNKFPAVPTYQIHYEAKKNITRQISADDIHAVDAFSFLTKDLMNLFPVTGEIYVSENSASKTTIVHEHQRHVDTSAKHPKGITTVHELLRRTPGTFLNPAEIRATFEDYDRKKIAFPAKKKIKELKDADKYDELIAVWTDFFNKKLDITPPLDPDLVKALIASESGFDPNAKSRSAFGISQITKSTLKVVQDPSGEARNFIFDKIRQKDLFRPEIAIPIEVRWLSRKKAQAKAELGREPTAEEIILEYKGLLNSKSNFKTIALTSFRKYYGLLKTK